MRAVGRLREVEDELIKELEGTPIPLWRLGKKYGVSRQTIFKFLQRRGIKRPKREHTEECLICQRLIRIAKKPHSDFISSRTIKNALGIGASKWFYHLGILRKKGLISQKFGRLSSERVEQAYEIYFKEKLPVSVIGKLVGLKNFHSVIQKYKASGWDVPVPLFTYDENERRRAVKRKREQ